MTACKMKVHKETGSSNSNNSRGALVVALALHSINSITMATEVAETEAETMI